MRLTQHERGTATPAALLAVCVLGAATTVVCASDAAEAETAQRNRYHTEALYQAHARLDAVASLVGAAGSTVFGENAALADALSRADGQFVGPDGEPTGVFAVNEAEGLYAIVAVGRYPLVAETVGDFGSPAAPGCVTRSVRATMRARPASADLNRFLPLDAALASAEISANSGVSTVR